MKEIKFTKDHIKKITEGRKISTLRTVKESYLYPIGSIIKISNSEIKIGIKERLLLKIKEQEIERFESGGFAPRKEYLAKKEGFDSYRGLVHWFVKRNYNIPQVFFNYWFEKVE